MYKLKTRKYPYYSSTPTHKVMGDKYFIDIKLLEKTDGILPVDFDTDRYDLPALNDVEIILLNYGLGQEAKWSLVKIPSMKDIVGYVPTRSLVSINNSKDLFDEINKDNIYAANWMAEKIEWYRQTPYLVFDDIRNGHYAVNWEFPDVTEFTPATADQEDRLTAKLKEAFEEGTKLILKNSGFDIDNTEALNAYLYNYYSFCRAEEWYIDIRPCSHLKVLVTIPKNFIHSTFVSRNQATKKVFDPSKEPKIPFSGAENNQQKVTYKEVVFNNYDEYNEFFKNLIYTLEVFNTPFSSREWIINPYTTINFEKQSKDIKLIKSKINKLIVDNAFKTVVYKPGFSGAGISAITNEKYFLIDSWKGKLSLTLDEKNIKLVNIRYFFEDKEIIFTNGFYTFLFDPLILNKTYINYFINFKPKEDNYDYARSIQEAFGDSAGEELNVLSAIPGFLGAGAAVFGGLIDDNIIKFLKEEHYPSVEASPKPLDIANCVMTNYDYIKRIADNQLPSIIEAQKLSHEKYVKEQPKKESDDFIRAAYDFTNVLDPNLRILLFIDQPEGDTDKDKFFSYISAANMFDWAKFLSFATQCLARTLDPALVAELLKKYQAARKFIENVLLATLCNPFLTNALKTINGISIPQIQTNASLDALAKAIEQAFFKMLFDVIATLLKKVLNEAIKACMANPNSEFGGTNPDDIKNPLDDAMNDDPQINDLMNDLFDGFDSDPTLKDEAKQKVKDFFDDLASCLSTSEMCKLLAGYTVNDEVYEFILALAKRKYSQPFVNKFEDREYIKRFFSTIGSKIDLEICRDFLNDEQPRSSNFLCDDGKIQKLRRDILSNKGMTDEMVDELLEDIKNKELKALEDILKILNSDNPFDFSQVPDLACQIFPNGESIAPPQKSMEATIDGLYDSIYSNFNEEAAEWYKLTYSISSSKPSTLEFDQSTGAIKPKSLSGTPDEFRKSIDRSLNVVDNSDDRGQQPTGSISDTKIAFYLYQSIFGSIDQPIQSFSTTQASDNNNFVPGQAVGVGNIVPTYSIKNYNYVYLNENNKHYSYLNTYIDGYRQQKLDLKIIEDTLRKNVELAEETLTKAVSQLEGFLLAKFSTEVFSVIKNVAQSEQTVGLAIAAQATQNNEFYRFIKMIDMYLNSNIVDSYDVTKTSEDFYKVLGFKTAQEAASFYSLDSGIPLYLLLADSFFNSDGTLKSTTISFINYVTSINTRSLNIQSNFEAADDLKQHFVKAGIEYAKVRKYFKTVLSTSVTYPKYELTLKSGINNYSIPLQKTISFGTSSTGQQFNVTLGDADSGSLIIQQFINDKLYDIYNLNINKNKKNYINITDFVEVDDRIKNYIINNLEINNLNDVQKHNIFNKFLSKKFIEFNSLKINFNLPINNNIFSSNDKESYEKFNKNIIETIKNNTINSRFNFFINSDSPPTIKREVKSTSGFPYTQYLKLVIEPTQQQKICNQKPHYLDIDSVKNEVKENQKKNTCARQIVNDDTINMRPVDSNAIHQLETTDTQKTLLNGVYRLSIRLYLHDIVLRALNIFGYYDPQSLRNDRLFINFLTDMMEIEMRTADSVFFKMLTSYILDQYLSQNPNEKDNLINQNKINTLKKKLLRQIVSEELKNSVLLKLAKRIDVDTNFVLKRNNDEEIKLINVLDDIKNMNNVCILNNKSIYINTFKKISKPSSYVPLSINYDTIERNNNTYIKIYTNQQLSTDEAVWSEFKGTDEYKLLFHYLFPVVQNLSSLTISSVLCTSTRKQVLTAFNDTKKDLFRTAKSIQTGGRKVAPDANNPQTLDDENPLLVVAKFIIKALITMPLSIVKGFAEGSEPNLALVTTAYKLGKSFYPDLTSLMIPAVSIPAAVSMYIPAVNPILYWGYMAGGLWYSDEAKDPNKTSADDFFKALQDQAPPDCSNVINQDKFYLDSNNNPIKDQPIEGEYKYTNSSKVNLQSALTSTNQTNSSISQGLKTSILSAENAAQGFNEFAAYDDQTEEQQNINDTEKDDGFSLAGSKNSKE